MNNDIITSNGGLVSLVGGKDLSEVIKPLKTEIHLFDTYIAGTAHVENPTVFDTIEVDSVLSLQREDNKFDSNAIIIMSEGKKAGYVPERDNIVFARLMDAGKLLNAKVKNIEKKGSFHKISIGIYLVDF